MIKVRTGLTLLVLTISTSLLAGSPEVRVIGEMRRMFTAHDIGANVDLVKMKSIPHLYALGPLAGLKGEITVQEGQVLVSQAHGKDAVVSVVPNAKAVFLVYSTVHAWRQIGIPTNVVTDEDLASFLQSKLPAQSRSPFLLRGIAARAQYHIQNYQGKAKDLTHEAHDKAKVLYDLSQTPVELVGFFTSREDDRGSFVHQGQTIHIHLISDDRKSVGHLESIWLAPGAKLFLPEPD